MLALCGVGVVWCYACVCFLCVITCLNVFAYIYGCMSQARSQRHFGRGAQEGHDSPMLSGWAWWMDLVPQMCTKLQEE